MKPNEAMLMELTSIDSESEQFDQIQYALLLNWI